MICLQAVCTIAAGCNNKLHWPASVPHPPRFLRVAAIVLCNSNESGCDCVVQFGMQCNRQPMVRALIRRRVSQERWQCHGIRIIMRLIFVFGKWLAHENLLGMIKFFEPIYFLGDIIGNSRKVGAGVGVGMLRGRGTPLIEKTSQMFKFLKLEITKCQLFQLL